MEKKKKNMHPKYIVVYLITQKTSKITLILIKMHMYICIPESFNTNISHHL